MEERLKFVAPATGAASRHLAGRFQADKKHTD
jgi:hypothetical protein